MNEPDVRRFMCHPLTMIASDGGPRAPNGELTHPRSYGNNARVLGRYVRELKPLTLEAAVRKMTPLPARTFRLEGRGELKPGAAADIVVFDPDRVADQATFDQPRAYAVGFSDVFVNGTAVLRNETLTGEHPGKPVRLAPASRQDGLETANRARRQSSSNGYGRMKVSFSVTTVPSGQATRASMVCGPALSRVVSVTKRK